jgi:glycosyltransferase involved in cell wall biosynthesis
MLSDNGYKPDLRVQKEINTLVKLGYLVDLYCWDQDGNLPEQENDRGFNIFRIKVVSGKQQGLKKIKDLIKFYFKAYDKIKMQKEEYSYVCVHDFLMLPIGVFLKFWLKLPLIYIALEIYHLMEWEKYNSLIRSMIFSTERFLSRFIDSFIVVNQKRKDFYSKYLKNEIEIIGNWYDPYNGEIVELKKKYRIPPKDIIICYFGVLNFSERPINIFIESMMKIPNIHFFVAGAGKDEKLIANYEKQYDRLHFLGWQKNVRQYFNEVDYILYTMNDKRKYFEYSAPNTLYLAISHSTPLITNVPGEPQDLVQNHNIGYFIDSTDDIVTKIDLDLESENYLGKIKSIARIKDNFSWSQSENTFKKIFADLDRK